MKLAIILGMCGILVLPAYSQDLTQTVRGTVVEEATLQPLVGATVYLKGADLGSSTNEQGNFVIQNVPIGRYVLEASFVGYKTFRIPELLVQSGKETVLEITLSPTAQSLDEVVVQDEQLLPPMMIAPLSSQSFTVEETRRFAATFFDPSRLATSFPGVVGVNDQANHISVRG
ncbi:MAG: carboxypeptidase-like regulatory domain-containing protein, partial [Tunicatimonas sp.]|uniref:carboxypeptidase-like regulatory domain-containing protein n=1 Tax=Tunicatimonas sp. TaxID=1940096 RepID=UPI003C72C655